MKIIFCILLVASSAIYLYQKNDKNNKDKDKIPVGLDNLIDEQNTVIKEPLEIINNKTLKRDELTSPIPIED